MTTAKRAKTSRARGSHTHGWGSMKKHRGAGSRGGRGNAGSGKRADVKKPNYWKNTKYFGKHGFTKHNASPENAVNVEYFEQNADLMLKEKKASEENGVIVVDATALGITKVIGKGSVSKKFKITVNKASPKAQEVISGAGGTIVLPDQADNVDNSNDSV